MELNRKNYFIIFVGFTLIGVGISLMIFTSLSIGALNVLAYIIIMIGFILVGCFGSRIIISRIAKNNIELVDEFEIEEHDERNIEIRNKAKAKAFDLTIFLFSPLLVVSALMKVDLLIIILSGVLLISVNMYMMIMIAKYQKEM